MGRCSVKLAVIVASDIEWKYCGLYHIFKNGGGISRSRCLVIFKSNNPYLSVCHCIRIPDRCGEVSS
jgi:hypothetical protein